MWHVWRERELYIWFRWGELIVSDHLEDLGVIGYNIKFNIHGSVRRKYIPIYIQQDATLLSLFMS
jgi:hypothetical protein